MDVTGLPRKHAAPARRSTRVAAAAAFVLCVAVAVPAAAAPPAAPGPASDRVAAARTLTGAIGPWETAGPTRTFADRLVALGTAPVSLLADGTSGIWHSADGGETWAAPGGLPRPERGAFTSSSTIGVDPADPSSAVVAVGADGGYDLYRSSDAGASWTRVESDALAEAIVFGLAVVPAQDGPSTILAVDGNAGLLRSTDDGATFAPATNGIAPDADTGTIGVGAVAASSAPGVAFASTTTAVYRTVDGGATWGATCRATDTSPCGRPTVAPGDPRLVLLSGLAGVVRSEDGGMTWTRVGVGLLPGVDEGGIESVVVSATEPAIVIASGTAGLFRSADGGVTWSRWDGGIAPSEYSRPDPVAVDPALPAHAWRIHETSFFSSTDGGASWIEGSGPDPSGTAAYAALGADGAVALVATDSGIVRRAGDGWRLVSQTTPITGFAADGGRPGRTYASTYGSGVLASDDGGETWAGWSRGLPKTIHWSVGVIPGPDGRVVLASDAGVLTRAAAATTWRRLGAGLPDAAARAVIALGDGGVVAGLEGRGAWRLDRDATRWHAVGLAGLTVLSLAALSRDGRDLLAATESHGAWRTTDGGTTWGRTISTGATASIAYDPVSRVAVVASGIRVHASVDGGRTWRRLETGLPPIDPHDTWMRRTTAVVVAAGGGLVLTTFGGTYLARPPEATP
jgi:photosystem II stability/assembly factor-like uncharacterized protein